MMRHPIFVCLLAGLSALSFAQPLIQTTPETHIQRAAVMPQAQTLPENLPEQAVDFDFSALDNPHFLHALHANPAVTAYLLHQAINAAHYQGIEKLLPIYQQAAEPDPILILFAQAQLAYKREDFSQAMDLYRQILAQQPTLTPVRIQLAIALFKSQQDQNAQAQFEQALSDQTLPADIRSLIEAYLAALVERNAWQFGFSAHYAREKNVNNAASARYIENTPFEKGASMLPQKANGVAYGFWAARDFNLHNAHYLHFANQTSGKIYWDNHDFDELTSRTYLGYEHKQAAQRLALLPFFEQQWYANHRYKQSRGVRLEFNRWLSPNWQLSAAVEYGQNRHRQLHRLNGHHHLNSLTLLWRISPTSALSFGGDHFRERTAFRHQNYQLNTLRFGWSKEWLGGISTRMALSYSQRRFQGNLVLGGFRFNKRREDEIYQLNLTAWKRDWHLFGITPKIQFRFKKQQSNFASLYRYHDKSLNLLLEKQF